MANKSFDYRNNKKLKIGSVVYLDPKTGIEPLLYSRFERFMRYIGRRFKPLRRFEKYHEKQPFGIYDGEKIVYYGLVGLKSDDFLTRDEDVYLRF